MDMSIRFPGAGLVFPYIVKTIRIFRLDVSCYGILIAMGMVLAMAFVVLEARRSHENPNHYLDVILAGTVLGIAGARAYYIAFYWSLYKSDPRRVLDIRSGGLAFYGGLLGGILALLIVCAICREASFWKMADTLSLGMLLGQCIGRWGDFFNRSSFGEYTEWPVAMQLPLSAVHSSEVTTLMRENLVQIEGASYVQVHPTFLYESIWCLLLLIILLFLRRRKLFDGEIFFRYLAGYGFGRAFIEFLRTDRMLIPGTDIPINMIVSGALFVIGTLVLFIRRGMEKKRSRYRRQRRELKYEFEEKIAREEEEREIRLERKTEAASDLEAEEAGVPVQNEQTGGPEDGQSREELMAELEAVVDEIEEERRAPRKRRQGKKQKDALPLESTVEETVEDEEPEPTLEEILASIDELSTSAAVKEPPAGEEKDLPLTEEDPAGDAAEEAAESEDSSGSEPETFTFSDLLGTESIEDELTSHTD